MRLSLLCLGVAGAIAAGCLAAARVWAAPSATQLPPGFTSNMANVNGVRLHFVSGGSGPALVLIHGFPQDWSEYRAIMPRLAKRFTVMALDLRGIGQSSIASKGYDADTMANDAYELTRAQKLDHIYVVGHDLGSQVAYAFARQYPAVTRGVMLLDSPLPGTGGWDDVEHDPSVWHIHFMQVPGLPEKLLAGRQNALLDYFLQFGKFTAADRADSYAAYDSSSHIGAALAIYRAFPANGRVNAAAKAPNDTPITIATGDKSPFAHLIPTMAAGVQAMGFSHVDTDTVANSVHYLVEDNPDAVATLIERHAGK